MTQAALAFYKIKRLAPSKPDLMTDDSVIIRHCKNKNKTRSFVAFFVLALTLSLLRSLKQANSEFHTNVIISCVFLLGYIAFENN